MTLLNNLVIPDKYNGSVLPAYGSGYKKWHFSEAFALVTVLTLGVWLLSRTLWKKNGILTQKVLHLWIYVPNQFEQIFN